LPALLPMKNGLKKPFIYPKSERKVRKRPLIYAFVR
jgi:hypothetical protein